MTVKKEVLCYDAGINAIRHIIDLRNKKTKGQFNRLDEDKNVPFVVPFVTWDSENQIGSLNNEHWVFNVGYEFREALDLIFMKRVRNKQTVYRWSQGPIIAFKEGDLIRTKDNKRSVQVRFSNPMGWDTNKDEMYYGSVSYLESDSLEIKILSQIDFLNFLITGKVPSGCV